MDERLAGTKRRSKRLLVRAGGIFVAWAGLAYLEQMYVLIGSRPLFAGSWEISAVRQAALPLLLALAAPAALALSLAIEGALGSPLLAFALGALFGGASGWGASFGRHFAALPVRVAFVAASALAFGFALRSITPRIARAAEVAPMKLAAVGGALGLAAWWVDGHAFLHLYSYVHLSVELLALILASTLALVVLRIPLAPRLAPALLGLGALLLLRVPHEAKALKNEDNVRFVLVEHAPLLGRAVEVAALVAPPPSLDDADETSLATTSATLLPGEIPRALDWSGHDVVLLSIDAVRADHVGAYGYARNTTPGIDALAAEGTLFESAYCPTPHTSYSITSMMTGKYMRPLLSLGLGDDSETWAGTLRRYDYRTAAFYPPAVFFVDQPRFGAFESRGLDFEYRRVEFRDAALRVGEVANYLKTADLAHPLFLWVHLFEPHEPYIFHPDHPFGDPSAPTDVDRYDSEIATADAAAAGIVATVRQARASRGSPVVIVTADHGEEFGEHGGRYHGGDVFTEQVRVPLIVVGPGVKTQKVAASVQTIDLYPTTISALGIPRPARVRGGDLGPLLAGVDPGTPRIAFSENDDFARVTRGDDVLVCRRSVRACTLYNRTNDPSERQDVASSAPEKAQELRRALTAIERENGRFERGDAADLPEPIRRGLQGDASAAMDVAALLDDAKLAVRQKAAEVLWRLHDPETVPAMHRAVDHDLDAGDEAVRRWCLLGLVRTASASSTDPLPAGADALLHDPDIAWRRRAALSFAERHDNRGEAELVSWWTTEAPAAARGKPGTLAFDDARGLLAAMETSHAKTAAPAIAASLDDVRLRPEIARVLATLGVPSVIPALLEAFANERYVSARDVEANALVKLGAHEELRAPLARFAGLPEPMTGALGFAADAHLLDPAHGGLLQGASAKPIDATLKVERARSSVAAEPMALRLLVGTSGDPHPVDLQVNGVTRTASVIDRQLQLLELSLAEVPATATEVRIQAPPQVSALWLVPRTVDLPPPAPVPWKPN